MNHKRMEITPNIQKLNEAIDLIHKAKELIDEVLEKPEIRDFQFVRRYYVYGKYGFNQLLGTGNPHDDSLDTLIEELKKEGL